MTIKSENIKLTKCDVCKEVGITAKMDYPEATLDVCMLNPECIQEANRFWNAPCELCGNSNPNVPKELAAGNFFCAGICQYNNHD